MQCDKTEKKIIHSDPETVYPPHIKELINKLFEEGPVLKIRDSGGCNSFEINPLVKKIYRLVAAEKSLQHLLDSEAPDRSLKKASLQSGVEQ